MSNPNAQLKVIAGPMFAGKTEELMRLIKQARIVGKRVLVIKSPVDPRAEHAIVSRGLDPNDHEKFVVIEQYPAHPVTSASEFDSLVKEGDPNIIIIDEAQFFEDWLVTSIEKLLEERKNTDLQIVASGLDMDYQRLPFEIVAKLMALADEVMKVTAFCFRCKKPALFTQKNSLSTERIEADSGTGTTVYEARCRVCHVIPK